MTIFNCTGKAGVLILLLISLSVPLFAQDMAEPIDPITTVVPVMANDVPIPDAEVIFNRMEHGISFTMHTLELEPGHVYTIWWVIFNYPENCSNECGLDDVFMLDENGQRIRSEDGPPLANEAQREAAAVTNLRATGTIANADGSAEFIAHLPIGDLTDQVLFGPGLINPMGAEVHLVVRTHGPIQPELISEQLNTDWGGCPDPADRSPCEDVQLAVAFPPS